jgi:hypothetical protein
MFDLISKFFFWQKKTNKSSILANEQDVSLISVAIDTKTEQIGLFIDVHPYNIEDKRMIPQAEKLAKGFHILCGDSVYLTQLVLDNIDVLKKKSDNNSVFFDNVLFFWNHYLSNTTKTQSGSDNDPVIKPTRVFK